MPGSTIPPCQTPYTQVASAPDAVYASATRERGRDWPGMLYLVEACASWIRLSSVSVVVAKPAHHGTIAAPRWLLPVFLPAAGGEVEPVVGAGEQVGSAGVAGVGVEDAFIVAQEGADPMHFAGPALPLRTQISQAPVVVLDGRDGLVEGDMKS
jgi:hypothetical protein